MPGPRSLIQLTLVTLAYLAALPWLGSMDLGASRFLVLAALVTVVAAAVAGSCWPVLVFPSAVAVVFLIPDIVRPSEAARIARRREDFAVPFAVLTSMGIFVLSIVGCTAAELTRHFYSAVAQRRRT